MRRKIILSAIITSFVLGASGCGVKGDLKTPPPIFGEKTKQQQDDKPQDQQDQDGSNDSGATNP